MGIGSRPVAGSRRVRGEFVRRGSAPEKPSKIIGPSETGQAGTHHADDFADLLGEVESGGVELDGIGGRSQRRERTRTVSRVALGETGRFAGDRRGIGS